MWGLSPPPLALILSYIVYFLVFDFLIIFNNLQNFLLPFRHQHCWPKTEHVKKNAFLTEASQLKPYPPHPLPVVSGHSDYAILFYEKKYICFILVLKEKYEFQYFYYQKNVLSFNGYNCKTFKRYFFIFLNFKTSF